MKKTLSKLSSTIQVRRGLLFLLLIANVSAIYASDTQVDGIWYNFNSSTKTASVTYRGSHYSSYQDEYSGSVVIPETVTYNGITYSVTSIGDWAFKNCSSLTSVAIGKSVTSIGGSAFSGCSSLTSVTIGESVASIGDYAFYRCSSLTSVTIGESVTSIGEGAFSYCSSLTSVTINSDAIVSKGYSYSSNISHIFGSQVTEYIIGESVTSIGYYAFYGCSSLTSVTIPNSVTSIGKNAFSDCSSLTSVTIPNSVTSIGDYAFEDCSSLTSMTIPNSVTSIGEGAFSGCTSLTSVNIPNSVTSIRDRAFYYCSSLTSVTIPNSVTSIGNYAFEECSKLTSVTIPNSVTSIGEDAFYFCTSLAAVTLTANSVEEFCQGRGNVLLYNAGAYGTRFIQIDGKDVVEITIPNCITSIGDFAFYGCTSLTSVTIPNSVTSIGEGAFSYCFSLTSVTIPNSVTSIGEGAFYYCSSLASVTIPNSVTSIGDYAFSDCTSLPVENNLRYADTYLVEAVDRTLSTYSIKGGTKWVGNNAFEGCGKLTSITIPNSVTSIGVSAFSGCNSLTSVTIPNSVTSIGESAFSGCNSLPSVTIPNSVTSIGESAFSGCNSLTSVTIPNSVTSIGKSAFSNCSKLTSVTINSDAIVSKDYSYSSNISHIFGSQVTEYIIGDSVTSIGDDAFYNCSKLTSVTIGNSVTSIGEDAFYYCSKLTKTNYTGDIAGWCNIIFSDNYANPMYCSHNFYINDQEIKDLVIPNNVTSIGSYAFNGCSSLTSVTIPNSVTSIGGSAFYRCSKLTKTNYTGDIAGWCNIIFGDNYANPMYCSHNFYINDQEIKDLVIPNNVTSIGSYAFNGCSSLTSMTIPNSVTSIGRSAFEDCSKLTSVSINSDAIVSKAYSDASNISHIFGSQVTEYIIGDEVKSIGNGAFSWCSSLTSVTIGESVRSIGKSAFYECSKLASMTCEAITPPSFINSSYTFYGVSESIPVYVPCGCVEAYNTAGAWGNFTNIQEPLMEYSVEVDANDTIMGTTKVDHNTFCQGTQISATPNIGYHFVQWSDGNTDAIRTLELTQDTILTAEFAQSFFGKCGNNLYWELIETTLHITGSGEMYNYTSDTAPWKLLVSSIKSLTIAGNVTSIERSAFSGCSALESVVWSAKNFANPANTEVAPFIDIRSQIKSFTFGDNVEHIPAYLCYGMDKLTSVTTPNKLNTIGTSAFEGCARLAKISLGTGLEDIAANAFAGCTRLYDIYTYATYPPFADESSFANYNVYVYIPCEYQRDYILDVVWGKFKFIECLESEDVTTDGNVTIVPSYNDVTITWPTEDNADTYTIIIKNGDEVFCTLTFNSEGQLLNIAFAPGRDGNRPAQYAEQAVNGYRFTVTGLTEATRYAYSVTTKDAANQTIATYSGEFTTKGGTTTDMDNIQSPISNCQKILRNGQLIIVRDGVEYNAMGQEM